MLFGIKKIQVCQANQLQGDYVSVPNQIITELTNALDDVPFIKNQSLFSIEESIENNETIFKSTLTFVSECQPQLPKICAFVITLNNNMRFLIGTPTRPFVEVTTRLNIAATASDTTAYTTTCTYQSNYRPLLLPTIENQISDDRQFEICCGKIIKKQNKYQKTIWRFAVVNGTNYSVTQYIQYGKQVTPPPIPTEIQNLDIYKGTTPYWYEDWGSEGNLGLYMSSFPNASENFKEYNAAWINPSEKQKIYWYIEAGLLAIPIQEYDYNDNIEPIAPPTRQGYIFKGWTNNYGYALNADGTAAVLGMFTTNYGKAIGDRAFIAVWEPA